MKYYQFDEVAISKAVEAAQKAHEEHKLQAEFTSLKNMGSLRMSVQCISVTVEDHKVCLNLPLGFGKVCLPIPISIGEGTAAEACIDICTTWGVPTGVKAYVKVAGVTVASQSFGKC